MWSTFRALRLLRRIEAQQANSWVVCGLVAMNRADAQPHTLADPEAMRELERLLGTNRTVDFHDMLGGSDLIHMRCAFLPWWRRWWPWMR